MEHDRTAASSFPTASLVARPPPPHDIVPNAKINTKPPCASLPHAPRCRHSTTHDPCLPTECHPVLRSDICVCLISLRHSSSRSNSTHPITPTHPCLCREASFGCARARRTRATLASVYGICTRGCWFDTCASCARARMQMRHVAEKQVDLS